MKKVGTFTSAIGFIFIGVWMILRNVDKAFSQEVFKWWPIIIILFGVEIIFFYGRKGQGQKIGFNFLVIPLIIIFLIINVIVGIGNRIGKEIHFINNDMKINLKDFNIKFDDDKKIKCEKSLEATGNKLNFTTRNGEVNFKKSQDGKIKFDLMVYVDENEKINSYNLKEVRSNEEIKVDINENYVKGVKGDIYVPDGYKVVMNINNMKLQSENTLPNIEWNIKSDNGFLTMNSGKSLILNMNNGKFNGKDIKIAKVKVNNGSVDFKGNLAEGDIQVDNGKVDIENRTCKDINVGINIGTAEMKTSDGNLNVNLDVSQGKCSFNDDRRINSGIVKTIGSGAGKLNMKVKVGSVKVNNQE